MTNALVLALGGTVDYEIAWDERVLGGLIEEFDVSPDELDSDLEITDERSLLLTLLAFVRDGGGGERFVADTDVIVSFARRFQIEVTLGGTGVRAAIALDRLGVSSAVHLVNIDDHTRRLLPASTEYICSATEDVLDPHLIVQYAQGAELRAGRIHLRAPHPNRVIYANDPPNRDLVISPKLGDLLADARLFLSSGFNVVKDEELLQDRLRTVIEAMKRLPKGAQVMYEDAGFHVNRFRAVVRRGLAGHVDVHSMNEDELQGYLGRTLDLLDPDQIVAAMGESANFSMAPVLVVHTKYWALAHGPEAGRYRAALEAGVDLASTRYCFGDGFKAEDLETTRKFVRHPGGLAVAAAVEARLRDQVAVVPARVLDVPRPTTIGLGDTFVGGFAAAVGGVWPG